MNERIKELEQQARFAVQDENGKAPYDKWRDKFAELIVQECVKLADEPTSRPFHSYGDMIKEHFGVK